MIKLLDGHSLTEKERFKAESMSLTLNQRNSTARMTIGPEAPEIKVGEWLQDMDEPGAGIVWRVKTIDDQRETQTRTLVLEHAIKTLGDILMYGEIKPSDMGGGTTCTAEQAITYILGKQSDWVLGTCSYSVSNPYNFNGDDLFSALETVSGSLQKCWWSYDFSSYPFTISFAPVTETVGVVLRECRNVQTAKITIDRQPMFTRFYPTGKNNLKLDGDYVSRNENVYGRKDKQETDQSKTTKAELLRWANERIENHCEPAVTVTVNAIDLSEGTGEPLDHIVLGAMCDMPLREYNTTITETITQINYPDKIREPEVATVTLANIQEDVASIIARMMKSSGRSVKTDAKNGEEDHAWIENTNEHVTLIAEGLIGKDSQGNPVDWSRISQLGVDGDGIHGKVVAIDGDLILAQTAIEANEESIRLEAERATEAEGTLTGNLEVSAGKINQVVTAVGADGEVTAASICLAINESGESSAVIDASKIYLLGQTIADTITANYIANKIAAIGTINANNILAGSVNVVVGQTTSPVATQIYVSGCPYDLRITQSGNTYTLQQKRLGYEAVWTDVGSFSRATTLSAGWDGNRKFTVGASPQGAERYTTLMSAVPNANVTWNGTTATLALKATIDDSETAVNVGDVTVNVANFLQDKTGSAKITQNGTYTPDTGYIGFSEIEIDVAGGGGSGTTTLSSSWSGGKITVTASPQGETLERLLQAGTVTWNGSTATIPISSVFGNSGQYSEGVVFSPSVDASAKINAASAAVTISNTLSWTTTPASGITANQNAVTVTTTGRTNSSGTAEQSTKTINLYSQVGEWGTPSANKCYVYVTHTDSSNGNRIIRREVDASSLVTSAGYAGKAAVTLNDPTWNAVSGSTPTSRTVTVTTSGRTNSSGTTDNLSKSIALYLTKGSWSNNKQTVFMRQTSTSGTVYAQTDVDASSLVTSAGYAGRAAVTISDTLSWTTAPATGITANQNAVTVSTTGRTNSSGTTANATKTINFYSQTGSWGTPSANKCYVYVTHTDSANTHRIIRREVDATSIYNNGYDANNTSWLYEQSTGNIAGNLNPGIWVTAGYRDHNNTVHYCGSRWYTLKAGGVRVHSGTEPSGVQTLSGNTVYEIYYDNGSGGTPGSGKYFKTPSSGTSYSHSASLYCYEISTGGSGVKTVRFSVQYSATQSVPFSTGRSYSMHW